MPTATKTPPAMACWRLTGVLGTYRYIAVNATASTRNSTASMMKVIAPGSAETSPRPADTTYEVVARLDASSIGPSVIAAQ
jgi:hypothetical protein